MGKRSVSLLMKKDIKSLTYIYSVRIYTSVISIILIPHIIKAVGIESYGLVGFFSVMVACLSILDAGVGGVLTRESIISQESKGKYKDFLIIYKKIIILFLSISIMVSIIGYLVSHNFGSVWLKSSLDSDVIANCMTLMFCVFSLRYIQGPFRSILLSNESQTLITSITLLNITISQPIALFLLVFLNKGIVFYFYIQLIAALITTLLMFFFSWKATTKTNNRLKSTLEFKNDNELTHSSLRRMITFALQLSLLSILWVFVNQSDKLTLSRVMNLSDYGIYSVAISVVGVLSILSDPINQYLQPKLTKCYFDKKYGDFTKYFFNSLFFIMILSIPLSAFFITYSEQIVYIWSNDAQLSNKVAVYLPWLFLGGVFTIFSNFIFILLYSVGKLKFHSYVYMAFAFIVIPCNIFIAKKFFGVGSSMFFAANTAFLFLVWGGYNLSKYFINGINVIYAFMAPLLIVQLIYFKITTFFPLQSFNRIECFAVLLIIGLCSLILSVIYVGIMKKKLPNYKFREI